MLKNRYVSLVFHFFYRDLHLTLSAGRVVISDIGGGVCPLDIADDPPRTECRLENMPGLETFLGWVEMGFGSGTLGWWRCW